MTVLIKGMEMPENCGECHFSHTENFKTWCCPTEREDILYDAIPEWCPLAEPKTGEWVDDCTCSICHWMHEDNNGFALITKYNYCPNCGAKMRGEEK